MDVFLIDWLNLLFRWAHLVVGVGWIGTSFYFIVLDLTLKKRAGQAEGVYGSAWQVHGGGFYNVEKYTVAPSELPDDLVWFKWEAYLTWVTGFCLIVTQYYINAKTYLIDPTVMELLVRQAIAISIASLLLGWLVYHKICKMFLGKHTGALAVCIYVFVVGMAYMFTHVFSGRGALIHVGALIGTMMAFNVFMIIIPNQKKIVASLMKGEKPDPVLGQISKQRSIHNNYLTLPVLLMMVSGHYPMITHHPHSWLLVALVLVIGGCVRHFFNMYEADHYASDKNGKNYKWVLLVAAIGLFTAIVMTAPRAKDYSHVGSIKSSQILQISEKHCLACHTKKPTHESFDLPPKSVVLDTIDDWARYGTLIKTQVVDSHVMPQGNETNMTESEREIIGAWLAEQRKKDE